MINKAESRAARLVKSSWRRKSALPIGGFVELARKHQRMAMRHSCGGVAALTALSSASQSTREASAEGTNDKPASSRNQSRVS
jgi:hypothetical protein